MKVKPKEVLVNLPVVLTFDSEDEVVQMAAAFNTFIHGKVKMKYEVLGLLGGQTVGLFYIQRNNESQELRDDFMRLIESEYAVIPEAPLSPEDQLAEQYDESFGDNKLCECGHPYYRHFDTYDNMSAIGCKYCSSYSDKHVVEQYCPYFKEKKVTNA